MKFSISQCSMLRPRKLFRISRMFRHWRVPYWRFYCILICVKTLLFTNHVILLRAIGTVMFSSGCQRPSRYGVRFCQRFCLAISFHRQRLRTGNSSRYLVTLSLKSIWSKETYYATAHQHRFGGHFIPGLWWYHQENMHDCRWREHTGSGCLCMSTTCRCSQNNRAVYMY